MWLDKAHEYIDVVVYTKMSKKSLLRDFHNNNINEKTCILFKNGIKVEISGS